MPWIIKRRIDLLKGDAPQNARTVGALSFPGDSGAHVWEITVMNGSEPAELTGTVTAYFKRSYDGNSVLAAGSCSGGVVTITIPEAAYAYPGPVTAIARITAAGTSTVTLDAIAFTVGENHTGVIVDPGEVIDTDDILAEYADMLDATAACEAATAAAENFTGIAAPAYSASAVYAPGDFVTYSGGMYRCTVAIPEPEAWTGAHWEETSAGEEIRRAVTAASGIGTWEALAALTGDGTLGSLPPNRVYYISANAVTASQQIADAPCEGFYGTVMTFAPVMSTKAGAVQIAAMPSVSGSPPVDMNNIYTRYASSASVWSGWKLLLNEGHSEAVKRRWEGTPFELIEYDRYERARMPRWNVDASGASPVFSRRDYLTGATRLHRCPRYLGFKLSSPAARLQLYIGTVGAGGEFTPDMLFSAASSGIANNLTNTHSQIVDVGDSSHWFYYCKSADPDSITIIGADEWPQSDTDGLALTPYGRGTLDSATQTYGVSISTSNNGIFLPAGCVFAVLPPAPITYRNASAAAIRTCVAADDPQLDRWARLEPVDIVPFGRIPDGRPGILAALPGTNTEECRVYIKKEVADRISGSAEQGHIVARTLSEFPWECAANRYMRHSTPAKEFDPAKTYQPGDFAVHETGVYRCTAAIPVPGAWNASKWEFAERVYSYVPNKRYHGVPYSSDWTCTHIVGFEISPFTMVSAAADEYSIFYDTAEGRTAIPDRDGPGMGMVCSSFASIAMGSPYPQTERGFSWDDNFICLPEPRAVSGGVYTSGNHMLYIDEVLRDGAVTYEGHAVGVSRCFYNGDGARYSAVREFTARQRMYDYVYRILPGWHTGSGYGGYYTDTSNLTPVNGTVRPWRGNRSVYGPYDVTKFGGIHVTIHDAQDGTAPTAIRLVKPGADQATDIAIPSGAKVVDITGYVDADGTYTLYSDADSTREYFRYRIHDPVTFTFDGEGRVQFSAPDVDYCYGKGTGTSIPATDDGRTAVVVFGKGSAYKRLLEAGRFDSGCAAAMVRDPGDANDPTGDTGSWGRYDVPCSYIEGNGV